MVRPAEYTRHAIIKAAVDLFAEKGSRARACGTSSPRLASIRPPAIIISKVRAVCTSKSSKLHPMEGDTSAPPTLIGGAGALKPPSSNPWPPGMQLSCLLLFGLLRRWQDCAPCEQPAS